MVQMPAVNTPQFSWVLSRLPRHAAAGAADLPARGRRPRGRVRRRPSRAAASTGSGRAPRRPWPPTPSRPGCSTATWPAPGSTRSRPTQPHDPDAPANLWEPADGTGRRSDFGAHGVFDRRSHLGRPAAVGLAAPRRARRCGRRDGGGRRLDVAEMVTAERIPRTAVARAAAAWHLLVGAALTARPAESPARSAVRRQIPAPESAACSGARSLSQAAVVAAAPTRRVLLGGAGVDIDPCVEPASADRGRAVPSRRAACGVAHRSSESRPIELAAVRTARDEKLRSRDAGRKRPARMCCVSTPCSPTVNAVR